MALPLGMEPERFWEGERRNANTERDGDLPKVAQPVSDSHSRPDLSKCLWHEWMDLNFWKQVLGGLAVQASLPAPFPQQMASISEG